MSSSGTGSELSAADEGTVAVCLAETDVIALDGDGRIVAWSEGARRLKGFAEDEVSGQDVSMFYVEEDAARGLARTELEEAARAGRLETEGWRRRKDGERFWANVVIKPQLGQGGEPVGFVEITRDATEQKRQERELRTLGFMLDALADYAVILIAPDGTIQTWNAGALRIEGYRAEEVVGQNIAVLYTPEETSAGVPQRELDESLRTGRFEYEGWHRRRDGERFWANVVMSPVRDADGEHIGFVRVTRDLTERLERDRLLQRQRDEILELSTPVIEVWDRVLVLPVVGTLDSSRAARLTENLLQRIASDEAAIVILDMSGVPTIDTAVAQHLIKTVQGARLMGADSIISGVRSETAQAMVHLGIEIGDVKSRSTLRDALQLAFTMLAGRAAMPERIGFDRTVP